MADLPPVPIRSAIVDQMGRATPAFADWLQKAFIRMGGHLAPTNADQVATAYIADGAVTSAKIAAAVAGSGLAGGAGSALSVNVDGTTLEVNSDTLRIKDGGVSFAKLLGTDWTSSKATNGYQKFPSGLYLQWGVTGSLGSGTTTSTSFPTSFPTACRSVIVGIVSNSGVATTSTGQWGSGNFSTTAFDLYNRTSVALTFNWVAIGD